MTDPWRWTRFRSAFSPLNKWGFCPEAEGVKRVQPFNPGFQPVSAKIIARRFDGRMVFVPEGHTIVARRFIAGLAINKVRVPEGRLKLVLGCYEPGVPDRFEVKISAPRSEFRRPSGTQIM